MRREVHTPFEVTYRVNTHSGPAGKVFLCEAPGPAVMPEKSTEFQRSLNCHTAPRDQSASLPSSPRRNRLAHDNCSSEGSRSRGFPQVIPQVVCPVLHCHMAALYVIVDSR